ncbi:MAG TPA: molybdenum cofactor guanylyltransferase [Bacteroidales bacterium]|nr:molybdenum cofactor guanylyltransferase [Bacteroidales bacterium]
MNPDLFPAKEITGFVLAGGKSSRFGYDKSLYKLKGKTLVEYAIDSIRPWCSQVIISTNNYADYEFTRLPTIADIHPDCGPMSGIHSALAQAPGKVMAIIGCDLPYLDGRIFPFLIENLAGKDASAPLHYGFCETLCLVLKKDCLQAAERAISEKKYKVLDFLQMIETGYHEVTLQEFFKPGMFHNINTQKDLDFVPK